MITAWWIFVAFVLGGCAGLLLTALLRTAADQTRDALAPADRRTVRL
jgi:hypothetical protein